MEINHDSKLNLEALRDLIKANKTLKLNHEILYRLWF